MQAIIAIMLILLNFTEAGLIAKAPRTQTPPTPSQFYIITPTTLMASSTGTVAATPTPITGTSHTMTTQKVVSSSDIISSSDGLAASPDDDNNHNHNHNDPPSQDSMMTTTTTTTTTTAPTPNTNPEEANPEMQMKFVQTTYFACVTNALTTHCGWHEPILDASTSAAAATASLATALQASLLFTCFTVAMVFWN